MKMKVNFILLVVVSILFPINARDTPRIINGTDAKLGEFPYVVGLVDHHRQLFCTGTLITKKHSLTAAHCYVGQSELNIRKVFRNEIISILCMQLGYCVAGSIKIREGAKETIKFQQEIKVQKCVKHPKYHYNEIIMRPDATYDIAVVTVEEPFKLSDQVDLVSLATDDLPEKSLCIALGYGGFELEHNISASVVYDTLRYANLHMDKSKCGFQDSLPTVYCAYAPEIGIYMGDSGGPLIRSKQQSIQYGVASMITKISGGPTGGLFANVRSNRDWILETVGKVPRTGKARRLYQHGYLIIWFTGSLAKF